MLTSLKSSTARALLCAGIAFLPCAAQAAKTASVTIPFSNMSGKTVLTDSPTLPVSLSGDPAIHFLMDTGSTGIVVSSDNYTPPNGSVSDGAGQITYSSSGLTLYGNLYTTPVTFGVSGATASATVEILVATTFKKCPRTGGTCSTGNATGTAMCGVGFGQEGPNMPDGSPATNPFLNLTAINGVTTVVAPAYILTTTGVTLGATPTMMKRFRQVALSWDTTKGDWDRAPFTMYINGVAGAGTALMDTGVGGMFLTPPYGQTIQTTANCPVVGSNCPVTGTKIRIKIGSPGANYAFVMGADGVPATGTAAMPATVTADAAGATPGDVGFVNTTYHIFNQFDYLYDYTTGVVGFRKSTTAGSSINPIR